MTQEIDAAEGEDTVEEIAEESLEMLLSKAQVLNLKSLKMF